MHLKYFLGRAKERGKKESERERASPLAQMRDWLSQRRQRDQSIPQTLQAAIMRFWKWEKSIWPSLDAYLKSPKVFKSRPGDGVRKWNEVKWDNVYGTKTEMVEITESNVWKDKRYSFTWTGQNCSTIVKKSENCIRKIADNS